MAATKEIRHEHAVDHGIRSSGVANLAEISFHKGVVGIALRKRVLDDGGQL